MIQVNITTADGEAITNGIVTDEAEALGLSDSEVAAIIGM